MTNINTKPSWLELFQKKSQYFSHFSFWLSFIAVFVILYDFGFNQQKNLNMLMNWFYRVVILIGITALIIRLVSRSMRMTINVWIFDAVFLIALLILILFDYQCIGNNSFDLTKWVYPAILLVFTREFSNQNLSLSKRFINPAQLFIFSFFILIFIGTSLLILPNATYSGISFIDALFTSASAVCVTGLTVVDTGSYFTSFGQIVIVTLIQLGGIGIMTFTSYFSYFFKGGSSYENQLLLKEITNSNRLGEVFTTLKRIIFFTFLIEILGAAVIFMNLDSTILSNLNERVFFSIFHSISGFCNAGFSTLPDSLYDINFRYNYPIHLTIAFLFIVGGLGFPIIFNFFRYIKHLFLHRIFRKNPVYLPWIVNINTRIVMVTTLILLGIGTLLLYILEYNNTLAEHNGMGKIITAFFEASTPRTAGFNTVDTSLIKMPGLLIILLLMWVGASPGSTGGGIKTSTFALGILNIFSIVKGKNRIEIFKREISQLSIHRAFAVIILSIFIIGMSIIFIAIIEKDKGILPIAFECTSAFSTVGLSMGITGDLFQASKIILILTMFIGRVSMMTILVAVFHKLNNLKYRYPTEDILIN